MSATSAHRADIDGLRAIAVVAVLLFHASFTRFSGGYVGVDVFFVISGFLITQIILRELAAGQFSMTRFYARRVRRIFPALAATLLFTLAVGVALLVPYRLEQLGNSVAAVSLFVSNILFWKTSGYFGATAEQLPLLHTWSLAVEEQFYILYPLLLLAIHRFLGGRFRWWLCVAAVLSLMLGIYLTRANPAAAFYLAPTRAWQLLCGALVACNLVPAWRDARLREVEGLAGLAAILASVVSYTPATPFPGVAALVPTLGAALVIHAGLSGETIVGRVLGVRPIAFVGAISYSLYLVHWPVFVYAKQYAIVELTTAQSIALLFVSFVLAILSWRFVEQPFRAGSGAGPRHPVRVALVGMSAVMLLGVGLRLTHGLPARSSELAFQDAPALDAEWTRWRRCSRNIIRDDRVPCAMGRLDAAPTFVLWGDSHARALASGIHLSALNQGGAGFLANADGCPPLLGLELEGQGWCAGFNNAVLAFIAARPEVRTVFLTARWAAYVNGRLPGEPGASMALRDVWRGTPGAGDGPALFATGLARTAQRLTAMGRTVVIVDQVPEVGFDVPTAYSMAKRTGRDVTQLIAPTRVAYDGRMRTIQPALAAIDSLPNVRVLRISDSLCDSMSCRIIHDGRPLYIDGDHLSAYGARHLAPIFDSLFVTLPERRIY